MNQQLKTNRLIVFLLGILCLSQFVGTIYAQKFFDVFSSEKTVVQTTPSTDYAKAIARQTDGKLIVAGSSTDAERSKFALVRYNTNGSLDTTFGTGGKVLTAVGSSGNGANAVAVLPDGKILAAGGYATSVDNYSVLIKYNSNGTLDTSFGSGGIVTADFVSNQYYENLYAMAVQTDGKILVAGVTGDWRAPLARYNSNGTLDTTFGNGGIVIVSSDPDTQANAVAMQGNKILVVVADIGGGGIAKLARFNSNGSFDYSFGSGGTVTLFKYSNEKSYAKSLAFVTTTAGEDKIVVAGSISMPPPGGSGTNYSHATIWSCSAYDGSPDTTFGTYGRVGNPDNSSYSTVIKVLPTTSGAANSIVVAGAIGSGTSGVTRYRLDGTLDISFNGSGTKSLDTGDITGMVIQPSDNEFQPSNSKIIVTGSFNKDFRTARYNKSGTLDTTFDGDGIRTDNISNNPTQNY